MTDQDRDLFLRYRFTDRGNRHVYDVYPISERMSANPDKMHGVIRMPQLTGAMSELGGIAEDVTSKLNFTGPPDEPSQLEMGLEEDYTSNICPVCMQEMGDPHHCRPGWSGGAITPSNVHSGLDIVRFTAYRAAAPDSHNADQKNPPHVAQYEGVVFPDGKCVLNWLTAISSISVWDSFADAMRIHGHPEYGTTIEFHGESLTLPWETHDEEG